jgi:hypothetical protein
MLPASNWSEITCAAPYARVPRAAPTTKNFPNVSCAVFEKSSAELEK